MQRDVVVLGAGIVGLATALKIQEKGHVRLGKINVCHVVKSSLAIGNLSRDVSAFPGTDDQGPEANTVYHPRRIGHWTDYRGLVNR